MNNAAGVTVLVVWLLAVVLVLIVGLVRVEQHQRGGWPLALLAVAGLLTWLYFMPLWLIPSGGAA